MALYAIPSRQFPGNSILSTNWVEWPRKYATNNPSRRLPLSLWNRGFHLCKEDAVLDWMDDEIFVAEYDNSEEYLDVGKFIICRRARLVEKVLYWNDKNARLFGTFCSKLVRGLAASSQEFDDVINVVEDYANGNATEAQMNAKIPTKNINPFSNKQQLAIGSAYITGETNATKGARAASVLSELASRKDNGQSLRNIQLVRLENVLEGHPPTL